MPNIISIFSPCLFSEAIFVPGKDQNWGFSLRRMARMKLSMRA